MNDVSFQHFFIGILAVANNIPAIAPFLVLTKDLDSKTTKKLVALITTSSFLVMFTAFFLGTQILQFFGITISAFQIAGGVLLCLTGMSMLNAKDTSDIKGKEIGHDTINYSNLASSAIVPISIPLTTGAGTISTITVFAESAKTLDTSISLALSIIIMTIIIYSSFYFANNLTKFLGKVGMSVMTKIMGLFTLAIGVQFMVEGIKTIVKSMAT